MCAEKGLQDERCADFICVALYLPVFLFHSAFNHGALRHTAGEALIHLVNGFGGKFFFKYANKGPDLWGDL